MSSSSPTSLPFRTAKAKMLPDMVASSTSRPDTQETAAYAASQPLFDVLRGAISRIDEQKAHLTGAKDTVQHIHVKVPQEHIENNGTLPNDYRDALVTAWKVTTESYVRIFEQLCELTGPDPASGREAEDSYVGFQKLLYTAEAARTVAFEQDTENNKEKGKADSSSESGSSAPSIKVKVATPNKNKQTTTEAASSKRTAPSKSSPSHQDAQRPAKKQRTITSEEASSTPVEKTTNQPTSQPTTNPVPRLKPKQIRKERKQRIQQHRDQQAAATLPPAAAAVSQPPEPPTTIIQAQYADVSAEVDARLRAKEEQKKAKKQAKKRKRDSQGSHILEAEPGAEQEAAELRRKVLAQKPAKKRSKSENGEGVRVDTDKKPLAKGKRVAQDESAQVEGARRIGPAPEPELAAEEELELELSAVEAEVAAVEAELLVPLVEEPETEEDREAVWVRAVDEAVSEAAVIELLLELLYSVDEAAVAATA